MGNDTVTINSQKILPHLVVDVIDGALGKIGFVVIDRPVRDASSGGVRFLPTVTLDEIISVARSMTYKWAFLNVPMGGAKAGIFADPAQLGCSRTDLMEAFGRSIAPLVLQGAYYPGIDMGTTMDDLRAIMRGVGQPLVGEQIDGSLSTALTVFEAIRQSARFSRLKLKNLRVAVEGYGKVASVLAHLLTEAGAKVVALSTIEGAILVENGLDPSLASSLRQQHGDTLVDHYPNAQRIAGEALYTQAVDVLVPGAETHVINAGNADQIQAGLIVPIANAPVTPEAEQLLTARGVVIMPDFVSNCGGILASDIRGAGFDIDDGRRMIETVFANVVASMLDRARCENRSVGDVARAVAWQNYLELDGLTTPSPDGKGRISALLKNGDWGGLWRRAAWRAHQRWPRLKGATRRAAVERFVEFRLGTTLARATSPQTAHPTR